MRKLDFSCAHTSASIAQKERRLHISFIFLCESIKMHFSLLQATDDALGRVNYTYLSDQTLIELFMEGFDKEWTEPFQNSSGEYFDIQEWEELTFDHQGILRELDFTNLLEGSVSFQFIPASVESVDLTHCLLKGTLDVAVLPKGLMLFSVQEGEELQGTVDFGSLPPKMRSFEIDENQFSGSADLEHLPAALRVFDIAVNKFTGTVSLKSLPIEMERLYIHNNGFSGSLDISNLPTKLAVFSASNCQFTGELHFKNLPPNLESLFLEDNKFEGELRILENRKKIAELSLSECGWSGEVWVHTSLHEVIELEGNKIETVFDQEGTEYEYTVDAKGFVKELTDVGCEVEDFGLRFFDSDSSSSSTSSSSDSD